MHNQAEPHISKCRLAQSLAVCLPPLQALLQLIDELHTCPSISIAVTSRIKPMSKYLLELPLLDIDSAVSLLRRHSGAQAATLQAEHATKLVQSCGCNALLLQVLGAMIASRRCQVKVRRGLYMPFEVPATAHDLLRCQVVELAARCKDIRMQVLEPTVAAASHTEHILVVAAMLAVLAGSMASRDATSDV